jgi:hypothetical protein
MVKVQILRQALFLTVMLSFSLLKSAKAQDSTLYKEDFSKAAQGALPAGWKTNGTGKVVKIDGVDGNWFQLKTGDSYKFSKILLFPARFTMEFDIVAQADPVTTLDPVVFGFSGNNSVTGYIQDAYNDGNIWTVSLLYFNNKEVNIASSSTKVDSDTDFDLTSFSNRPMHVVINADGNHVIVSLDGTKVTDTNLFKDNRAKFFFISAPLRESSKGTVAIGNIVVRKKA